MAYRRTPRIKARLERRRAAMLNAARQLFADRGYESTTMQQVAKASAASIGNLYFHFDSKESLFLSVVRSFIEEIDARVDAAHASMPPGASRFAAGICAGVLAVLDNQRLAAPVLLEEDKRAFRATIVEHFAQRFERHFTQQPELVGDLDPRLAAQACLGVLFELLERQLDDRLCMEPMALARFIARWTLQALGHDADQALLDEAEDRVITLEPPLISEVPRAAALAS